MTTTPALAELAAKTAASRSSNRPPNPGPRPPTLLSGPELAYLREVGAAAGVLGSGAGRIVELGCFLGGSTAALAAGLATSARREGVSGGAPPMLSYDSFVWTAWCDQFFPTGLRDGESFLEVTRANLGPLARHVELRRCVLPERLGPGDTAKMYPEAEPIGVLFVDCAKSWGVSRTLMEIFAPHLVPGRSTLISQDFKHHYTYWLPLHMHAWRACFRPVRDVVLGWTVEFEYTGGWTQEVAAAAPMPEDFATPAAVNDAWGEVTDWWLSLRGLGFPGLAERVALTTRLCHAVHLAAVGCIEGCLSALEPWRAEFERLRRGGALGDFHLVARDEYEWTVQAVQSSLFDAVKAGGDRDRLVELWPVFRRLESLRGGLFPAASLSIPKSEPIA